MAAITKVAGSVSLATTLHDPGPHQTHGRAATDLAAGDTVYLTSSGTLAKTNGTSADALAMYVGVVTKAYLSGEKAVAYHDVEVTYGAGLTPGARAFVATTAGLLVDAATTGGTVAVGFVSSATTIYFFAPNR